MSLLLRADLIPRSALMLKTIPHPGVLQWTDGTLFWLLVFVS